MDQAKGSPIQPIGRPAHAWLDAERSAIVTRHPDLAVRTLRPAIIPRVSIRKVA